MKFKKHSFISLILIFILFVFGPFSMANALNYKFDTKCNLQNLSNKDSFVLDLNLKEGYGDHARLRPFVLRIKFNNNLFEFKEIIPNKNISPQDISIENSCNIIKIKFNPTEEHLVPFSNGFSGILKASFVCNSGINCCHSYFQTDIVDSETGENVLSKFTGIVIKNDVQNTSKNTGTNKNCSSNQDLADCHLRSITPNIGNLNPSFNPNILKYRMEVPRETQEVYFDIVPISESTDIRVSKHRLGAPGTITYINVTSKNKSHSLSYLIEVKRSLDFSESQSNDKIDFKISGNVKVKHKVKGRKGTKSKHNHGKHKRNKKKPGNDSEESDESEDEDECEDDENSENDDEDKNNKKSSVIKSNKIYWIVSFIILVLAIVGYLFWKKKSMSSKNKENNPKNDINNLFEK